MLVRNDFIETPEGHRIRLIRPQGGAPGHEIVEGRMRRPGQATIDQWHMPEPPESA
ncbi:MAG: hypothetical protein ACLGIN_04385 [Candidatus Sericytochromatia bacterium]